MPRITLSTVLRRPGSSTDSKASLLGFQDGRPEMLGRPRVKHRLRLSRPGDPVRMVHVPDAPAGKLLLKPSLGLIKFR